MIEKFQMPAAGVIERIPNYLYLLPHPLLRPYIAHYTVTFPEDTGGAAQPSLELIPDASGCLVFTCGESRLEGRLWGATTRTAVVKNDLNEVPMRFFIEFAPGGSHRFTGLNQQEFTDRQAAVQDVLPVLSGEIADAFQRAQTLQELISLVDGCFLRRLGSVEDAFLPPKNLTTVRELAEDAGYSQRHLNRLFYRSVGMNVKTYLRLLRVNRALLALTDGAQSLTRVAQDAGYYDQPHFIHDFEAICGVAPGVYLERSDFYKEPHKF